MAASERIFKLLDTPVTIEDKGTLEVGEFESLELRNVSFAYVENESHEPEWVLRNVSFRVGRGERVALVGHTGAGKTTVTSLLLRFYEPQRGEILVKDRKSTRLNSSHSQISYAVFCLKKKKTERQRDLTRLRD